MYEALASPGAAFPAGAVGRDRVSILKTDLVGAAVAIHYGATVSRPSQDVLGHLRAMTTDTSGRFSFLVERADNGALVFVQEPTGDTTTLIVRHP
jgi:hypothetical protein